MPLLSLTLFPEDAGKGDGFIFAKLWNFFIEEGMKGREHENYMELKYEDLCLKPITTINKISKFLNQDYDKDALDDIRLKIKPSLDKYNLFNRHDLEKIENIIKTNMEKLGYDMER